MRTLIVCNITSLDGYYEGPGGNVMALPMDPAFDAYNRERLDAADTLLLGRHTFEGFQSYWPPVAGDATASEDNRAISRRNAAIAKLVVSDSLVLGEDAAWRSSSEVVARADAAARIAALKAQPGRDILVFGSRTMWTALLAAGVVDELHLMVGAKVLGGGTPLFAAAPPEGLRLLGTRRWDGSDNVLLRYAVRAA